MQKMHLACKWWKSKDNPTRTCCGKRVVDSGASGSVSPEQITDQDSQVTCKVCRKAMFLDGKNEEA